MHGMKLLGIETSCDETAVCIIAAEGNFGAEFRYNILGNALLSQATLHAKFGGVFPNLAKREHAKNLVPILKEALGQAGELRLDQSSPATASLKALLVREPELLEQLEAFLQTHAKPDVDAIAVTAGPGLEPALWVGINFAKALSFAWNIPIVAANHMEGHIVLSMMGKERLAPFEFPALALLISGGHTELVLSKEFGTYQPIGQTRDDAAGEAFDKVARMLELPYPGGPEISRLAEEARGQSNGV
jgi:N6-L-threonylcarbamoyladenine synthase